jgi:hypothetical protein
MFRLLRSLFRSAVTGRFVSRRHAEENPRETLRERIHSPRTSRRDDRP